MVTVSPVSPVPYSTSLRKHGCPRQVSWLLFSTPELPMLEVVFVFSIYKVGSFFLSAAYCMQTCFFLCFELSSCWFHLMPLSSHTGKDTQQSIDIYSFPAIYNFVDFYHSPGHSLFLSSGILPALMKPFHPFCLSLALFSCEVQRTGTAVLKPG